MRRRTIVASVASLYLAAFALVLCGDAQAQAKNRETAEVFGVVKGGDGTPIVVHLRSLEENPVRYYDGYEEKTKKDGSFHFAGIEPGPYQVQTDGRGFTLSVSEPFSLHAGEIRKSIIISVTPSFSLCGRVTENGSPRADTWVNAYRLNSEFGTLSQTFLPHLGANGRFQIADVRPGTYYLAGYTTYYPGSFNFNGAKAIVVSAGTPTGTKSGCALEIPLQYTGCHATKVSGHITSVPDHDKARYRVLFLATNMAGGSMPAIIAMNLNQLYRPGDNFSGSVCEGSYDVVLSDEQQINPWSELPTHKVVFDTKHIEVGKSAIEEVQLTPRAMASISGEVPGMTHNVSCPAGGPRAQVSILREGDGEFQSAVLDDKNRFIFHNVAPGEYTVYFGPVVREAFYLDSILVDGKPIEGRKFTVAQPQPMSMVIHISGDIYHAAGHLSPDVRREPRWEVAWTRPKGSVGGKVLGVGMGDVTLKLRAARYNSNASAEYTARVGTDGQFLFDAIDPGVYTMRAEGRGILTTEYGARQAGKRGMPIVVARGAHIHGLTLSPPRLSALCGRVTNPEGTPQAGTRMLLSRIQTGGFYGSPSEPLEVRTDTDGRFRFEGLPPGDYVPASPLDVNRVVFFSRDGTLRTATPVTVQAGEDVGCGSNPALDLRVPPNYKTEYSFPGKIRGDLPAAIGDRFWVLLLDARARGGKRLVRVAKPDAEHRFSFENIPGGQFIMELHSGYGPEPEMWSGPYGPVSHLLASQTIDIQDGMKEAAIEPMQLPNVTGAVHFKHVPEEWKNNFDIKQQRITLVPRDRTQPFSALLSADGSFSIGPEDIGDYEVNLDLRAPLYIQSVRLNGREIKGRYFHVAAAVSANLEVEVSGDSGQVNSRLVPDGSLPIAEPSMDEACRKSIYPEPAVVLFPDPLFDNATEGKKQKVDSNFQPRLFRSTGYGSPDNPTLQVQSVPPGHYRALAIEGPGITISPFGRPGDPPGLMEKMWSAFAALGKPVTVQAGGTLELTLPNKTIEAQRMAAKLGISLERGLLDW
jgi:protocatechuate 3,4-dioxygenase beta subunit